MMNEDEWRVSPAKPGGVTRKEKWPIYWQWSLAALLFSAGIGAAFIAWHFPGRPFVSVLGISCGIALVATLLFAICNMIEAIVAAFILFEIGATLPVPFFTGTHWEQSFVSILVNGMIAGIVSSRVLRQRF